MNEEELQIKLEKSPSSVRVRQYDVEKLIANSKQEQQVFWGKEMVISFKLPCGFTVTGRSACVDPKNFDLAIGEKLCRNDAINKLWELEGYRLQNKWYEESN
ncbi:MAG: Gp49 family protein [Rivularia sp. (in: cyanobacteria)]